jgi:hypothetical protein
VNEFQISFTEKASNISVSIKGDSLIIDNTVSEWSKNNPIQFLSNFSSKLFDTNVNKSIFNNQENNNNHFINAKNLDLNNQIHLFSKNINKIKSHKPFTVVINNNSCCELLLREDHIVSKLFIDTFGNETYKNIVYNIQKLFNGEFNTNSIDSTQKQIMLPYEDDYISVSFMSNHLINQDLFKIFRNKINNENKSESYIIDLFSVKIGGTQPQNISYQHSLNTGIINSFSHSFPKKQSVSKKDIYLLDNKHIIKNLIPEKLISYNKMLSIDLISNKQLNNQKENIIKDINYNLWDFLFSLNENDITNKNIIISSSTDKQYEMLFPFLDETINYILENRDYE